MSDQHLWTLHPLKGNDTRDHDAKDEILAPIEEAIALIRDGKAWISKRADQPPWDLLGKLSRLVDNGDVLGPPTAEVHLQKNISEMVFPSNLRQAFVDGNTLHWDQSKEGLRELVGNELSRSSGETLDLFFLFRFISFESIERWKYDKSELKQQVYGEEYARDRPTGYDDFAVLLHWPNYSKEWKEFTLDALVLQADFENLLQLALATGRILVAQSTAAGDRYIPSNLAESFKIEQFDDSYYFALSKDLPKTISGRQEPLESRRRKATKWVEQLFEHYSGSNRKFTSKDVMIVMQEKFGLSANAAKDAWSVSSVPKSEFRNVKRSRKISIEEIRKFHGKEREK